MNILLHMAEFPRRVIATYVQQRIPNVTNIKVSLCEDGGVDLNWSVRGEKFERIRRITGYLVCTVDRWNDSKRAEEQDRVKHLGGSA